VGVGTTDEGTTMTFTTTDLNLSKLNAIRAQQFAFEAEARLLARGWDNFVDTACQTKMDSDWDGICRFISIELSTQKAIEEARAKAAAKHREWIQAIKG
jgi:hypothetical protein